MSVTYILLFLSLVLRVQDKNEGTMNCTNYW